MSIIKSLIPKHRFRVLLQSFDSVIQRIISLTHWSSDSDSLTQWSSDSAQWLLTRWLIHSVFQRLGNSLIHWLSDPVTRTMYSSDSAQWLIHSMTQWLCDSLIHWLDDPVTRWLFDSLTQWLADPVKENKKNKLTKQWRSVTRPTSWKWKLILSSITGRIPGPRTETDEQICLRLDWMNSTSAHSKTKSQTKSNRKHVNVVGEWRLG